MALLFNGDPLAPVGNYNGPGFVDPPWYQAYTSPLGVLNQATVYGVCASPPAACAATANNRIQILQDANGRFGSSKKYWRFQVSPGDSYAGAAGEKTRCYDPWPNNRLYTFEGVAKRNNWPAGPWGQVQYWGTSFKLDPTFTTPFNFCNIFEKKMTQAKPNGIQIAFNMGNQIAANDPQIRLFSVCISGPYDDSGVDLTGWKWRTLDPPHIQSLIKGVWYDVIIGFKVARDNTGWLSLWVKLATDTTWVKYDRIINDHTAPYYQPNNELYMETHSIGNYRGITAGNTSIHYQQGMYYADNFADVAAMFGGGSSPPPPPSTTLPDPVAGRTRTGPTNPTDMVLRSSDFKLVQKRAVGNSDVLEIRAAYAYFDGPVSGGAQTHKLVVYTASGGAPGALAGSGPEVVVAQGAAAGWVNLLPTGTISVTADATGAFFYGVISGGGGQGNLGSVVLTNGLWVNADTYSDGPSNPYGVANPANVEKCIVIDYVITGNASPPVIPTDTTAPNFQAVNATLGSVTVPFNEALDESSVPATSAFTVKLNGASQAIAAVSVASNIVTLNVPSLLLLKSTDIVLVSYTPPGTGKLRDLAANNVVAFTDQRAQVIASAAPTRAAPDGPRPTGTRPTGTRPSGVRPPQDAGTDPGS